jgi:hypothetical protein
MLKFWGDFADYVAHGDQGGKYVFAGSPASLLYGTGDICGRERSLPMFRIPLLPRDLTFIPVLLTGLLAAGCATLDRKPVLNTSDLANPPAKEQMGAGPAQTPHCTIVLQPGRGKPNVVQMPLTQGATVQTALDHAKACKRFRRMDIYVLRSPPSPGDPSARVQKMNVELNRRYRKVEIDSDYALHPNDQVFVEEDTSTVFDDMVRSVAGRLGAPIVTHLFK